MATTDYEARIQLALADLADQDKPNYMGTAKRFGVDRRTLRERFLGTRLSRKEATAEYHQCLTIPQEDALVALINRLTNRGLPPTNSMVKNLVKEMIYALWGRTGATNSSLAISMILRVRISRILTRNESKQSMPLCSSYSMSWYMILVYFVRVP